MHRSLFLKYLFAAVLFISCGGENGLFTLRGQVESGSSDSIIVAGLDMNFPRTDTIRPVDGQFTWTFSPDTATTLILILPDGRCQPVFADRDLKAHIVIPADSLPIVVSGSADNDAYRSFSERAAQDSCLEQTYARIDSFITSDPFSKVTPYLIYEYGVRRYHATSDSLDRLIKKMSGNMQDDPFIINLKQEFQIDNPAARYLGDCTVYDTAGVKHDLSVTGIKGSLSNLLLCVWATFDDTLGLKARRDMQDIMKHFKDYKLEAADVSIDLNPGRWTSAIEADTMPWPSYNDRKGLGSSLLKQAGIKSTPCYVLLSSGRTIQYVTASDSMMRHAMDSLLSKPDKSKKKKSGGK